METLITLPGGMEFVIIFFVLVLFVGTPIGLLAAFLLYRNSKKHKFPL